MPSQNMWIVFIIIYLFLFILITFNFSIQLFFVLSRSFFELCYCSAEKNSEYIHITTYLQTIHSTSKLFSIFAGTKNLEVSFTFNFTSINNDTYFSFCLNIIFN